MAAYNQELNPIWDGLRNLKHKIAVCTLGVKIFSQNLPFPARADRIFFDYRLDSEKIPSFIRRVADIYLEDMPGIIKTPRDEEVIYFILSQLILNKKELELILDESIINTIYKYQQIDFKKLKGINFGYKGQTFENEEAILRLIKEKETPLYDELQTLYLTQTEKKILKNCRKTN